MRWFLAMSASGIMIAAAVFWYQSGKSQSALTEVSAARQKLADEVAEYRQESANQASFLHSLNQDLTGRHQQLSALSNLLQRTETELERARQDLIQTRMEKDQALAEATRTRATVESQQAHIAALESQQTDLTGELNSLKSTLDTLNQQIEVTRQKLANAEGDREILLTEMRRLQGEREDLQRRFNDLSALRVQMAKLREDAVIHRRLGWMQRGVYARRDLKGAELLASKAASNQTTLSPKLQVELHQNGIGTDSGPARYPTPTP